MPSVSSDDLHRRVDTGGTGRSDRMRTIEGWFARRRLRSQLRRATTWTGTARPPRSLAKISGRATAVDDAVIAAPLSGRPCLCWLVEIRFVDLVIPPGQFVSGGRWSFFGGAALARDEGAIPFAVLDRGRRIAVDPHGARLALVFDHVSWSINPACLWWTQAAPVVDPAQRALRERLGLVDGNWGSPPPALEYREAIVAPGQSITVAGTTSDAPEEPLSATPFRDAGHTSLWLARAAVISSDPDLS